MSSVLVGSAYGVLELRSQQFDQGVDASLAKLAQLRQAFAQGIPPLTLPPIGGGLPGAGGSQRQLPGGLAPDIQKDEQAMVRYASSLAAAQKAQGDLSGAASTYRNVLGQLTPNTIEANRVTAQLASTEAALAKEAAATAGSSGLGAVGSQLSGLITPLTLITVGVGAAVTAFNSFGSALHTVGQLQEERQAFDGIYGSINGGNAVLDRAIAGTRAYGFTAAQTTDAFKQLAPIIRESTSSTEDQAGALERISELHPEDPANALAKAIEGIRKGRFQEIAGEMGLTKDEAKALSDQVAHGADTFIALNNALDKHGITLAVARDRMDGYAGAERRAQQAGEELQQAQAQFAQGPGLAILEEETRLVTGLSRVLGGSGGLAASFQSVNQNLKDSDLYQQVYNQSLENGATEAQADAAGLAALAQVQQASADAAKYAAAAYNSAAAAAAAVGRASGTAAVQVDSLTEALARGASPHQLPHINDSTVGATSGIGGLLEGGLGKLKRDVDQADQLGQALFDNQLKRAKDNAAKIALLKGRELGISDPIERARIEGQIIDLERQGGRTRVSAAASTGLQLQNVEENTQAQLLKAQREGLERLREQAQDYDLRRVRENEDEDEKIRRLFETGQRGAAAREKVEFEKRQRREREDYTIARQRTLLNNAESTGDITSSADRRTDQIDARAALRGVRPGGASLGSGATPAIGGGASGSTVRGPLIIGPLTIAPSSVQIDGKQFVEITWPQFEIKIDDEFSASLRAVGAPNSNQAALAGTAP